MKYLDYAGLQQYDLLIKQYIQDNIPDSSQAAEVATALKNAYNTNATIKVAVCTQAEYNALQNPESNVLYIISDETSEVVNVEANPTLDGTETTLTGLGIGGTNYKVGMSDLYIHNVSVRLGTLYNSQWVFFGFISKSSTPFNYADSNAVYNWLTVFPSCGDGGTSTTCTCIGINCRYNRSVTKLVVHDSSDGTIKTIPMTSMQTSSDQVTQMNQESSTNIGYY